MPEALERIRTARNAFGLIREYIGRPTHIPDDNITAVDLLDKHDEDSNKHTALGHDTNAFMNAFVLLLMSIEFAKSHTCTCQIPVETSVNAFTLFSHGYKYKYTHNICF